MKQLPRAANLQAFLTMGIFRRNDSAGGKEKNGSNMKTLLTIAIALTLGITSSQAQQTNLDLGASSTTTQSTSAKKALTYKDAYKKAQAGDKPLLILVTATWCPPCVQMKQTTIPELVRRDSFKDFHFAMLDYDKQSELADQLIGDRGLPQFIMFEKSKGQWLRRYMTGIQTATKVEHFMAQAGTFRTAKTEIETRKK